MKSTMIVLGVLFLVLSAAGCTGTVLNSVSNLPSTPMPALPPTIVPTPTRTRTPLPPLSFLPARTATATWAVQGPGNLKIPILIYHHIGTSPVNSRYYVPPETFEQEVKELRDLGYESITLEALLDAITVGGELPAHPILITFDDGNEDNYLNAYPILKKYGYTGVLYVVGNYLDTPGYLARSQILEMVHAGWEVGSHSLNHYDLTKLKEGELRREIVGSKKKLEDALGIDILTFAYPFGAINPGILHAVWSAGYQAAMGGEGYTDDQGAWNLFNLQRVEIRSSDTVDTFLRYFTWH